MTDLAAMMALVRLTGGTTSGLDNNVGKLDVTKKGQLKNPLRVMREPGPGIPGRLPSTRTTDEAGALP